MPPKPAVEPTEYPRKLFYKINEVASITGVEAYVLRYWETKFPTLAPEKDENDQRRYRQKDIELIFYIKKLLYEDKYTIAGAVEVLKQEKTDKKRRGGKKGQAEAETDEPEVMLIVQNGAGEADSSSSGTDAAVGNGPAAAPDPKRLGALRERLARIRKDLRKLVADARKWRTALDSGSR